MSFRQSLQQFPFIAITRGIVPNEAPAAAQILVSAGFTIIEVPLNSPQPFESIFQMVQHCGEKAIFGAGTVTREDQLIEVAKVGGRLIISPHCDVDLIKATKKCGLFSIAGVTTPTEAMQALQAGADALKLFPAEMVTPSVVKAIRAILPPESLLLPVGGIDQDNWESYYKKGADGFGLGSSLYREKMSLEELERSAQSFARCWSSYRHNFS